MIALSNNILQIEVSEKGAELQSLCNKPYKLEYLWSGDQAYWAKKSPVLFPIVGGLKNGRYRYKGAEYRMSRHGFARDMNFTLTDHTENSMQLSLISNEETRKTYPFVFSFSILYTLNDNVLEIGYQVKNTGDEQMFFSVGAHPAFKVPLVPDTRFEDYYLLFNREETAGQYPLSNEGLTEASSQAFFKGTNTLPLNKSLFEKDALVFKELQSTSISIVSDKSTHGVTVDFKGFPYMGIWSAKGADFLCIEPWDGIADSVNASGDLDEKEGIIRLSAGDTYLKTFNITIH